MPKLSDLLGVVVNELDATCDADGFSVEVGEYLSAFIVTRAGSEQHS